MSDRPHESTAGHVFSFRIPRDDEEHPAILVCLWASLSLEKLLFVNTYVCTDKRLGGGGDRLLQIGAISRGEVRVNEAGGSLWVTISTKGPDLNDTAIFACAREGGGKKSHASRKRTTRGQDNTKHMVHQHAVRPIFYRRMVNQSASARIQLMEFSPLKLPGRPGR